MLVIGALSLTPSDSSAGIHPTPTSASSLLPPSPPIAGTGEPFQAFLNYSTDLGPSANPSTILDFGSWDQSDLLVSLGLVTGGADLAGGWGLPPVVEATSGEGPPLAVVPVHRNDDGKFAYTPLPAVQANDAAVGPASRMGVEGVGEGSAWSRGMQEESQPPTDLLSRWLGRGEFGGAMEGS